MKILIVSSTVWDENNSFGNTFSNLFEGLNELEIANIYCNYGVPKNKVVSKYFQITEKSLIKNLLNNKKSTGTTEVFSMNNNLKNTEVKGLTNIKRKRWLIFFWIRRLIWFFGRWKSDELNDFIDEFKPDIIFVPLYYPTYLNRIILYVHKKTEAKLISYALDDVYSLKRRSYNIFYWMDRLSSIKLSRKVLRESNKVYAITDMQKKEIENTFKKKVDILQKGIQTNKINNKITNKNTPLKVVYTGNLYGGRLKSIYLLSEAIEEINNSEVKVEFYIYSGTELSKKEKKKLNTKNNTFFMGSVDSEEIIEIQKKSDVLVHVEALNIKERLEVRHSLSTKIIDYLSRGNTILAIGFDDIASINYLKENKLAMIASNREEIKKHLLNVINQPNLSNDYRMNNLAFAKEKHNIDNIQRKLLKDFNNLLNQQKN